MLKLALTPKWIAALVGCILLGVIFALLAQWQISRSVLPSVADSYDRIQYKALSQVATPGTTNTFEELDSKNKVLTEVSARVKFTPGESLIVKDRIQVDGESGSWLVVPARTETAGVFVVVGFIPQNQDIQKVLAESREVNADLVMPILARYIPSEAPIATISDGVYGTLSVPQLINSVPEMADSYNGVLAIERANLFTKLDGVKPVTIGLTKVDSGLNWLSAFYALEWTFFGLFALFMWWRLLADAYRKQQEELLEINS